ncbi:penicillin-binding protein 1C [Algivirga pacifica]|uniref:peptidoglycan glycosyltransferase n=2 Tax=Algivirga pacifica TaxID=1162670 RepID=A0ABP9DKR9_9BACT
MSGGILLILIVLHLAFPFKPSISYSTVYTSREGSVLGATLNNTDKWRMEVQLEDVSEELITAILFKEDRFFYYHLGVNPLSIIRALSNNILQQKVTSGASTISMQVVRLLTPKPRTLGNKIIEAIHAIQLELSFSKKEILEMYLNLIPYGGNIEGVKAASLLYFDQSPKQLSLSQATILAIIPNRPTSWRIGQDNQAIQEGRDKWLRTFEEAALFPKTSIATAFDEPVNTYRRNIVKKAPHLTRWLGRKFQKTSKVNTTIDASLQFQTQTLTKRYVQKLHHYGIHQAAVLVIDNEHREVLAYVGSADFHNNRFSGQIDGVRALRSPGSTLKPFIYGMAFDQGIYTPQQKVLDVETHFKNYSPKNYDNHFHGSVSIAAALQQSLNIPAVKALDKVGLYPFIQALKKNGFESIGKQEHRLGLSLALGGCGVKLLEVTNLYASLANKGTYMPLRFLLSEQPTTPQTSQAVVSEASAYMLQDILTEVKRPDFPQQFLEKSNLPKIAWKTGTSYGRKDAWSVGFNKRYTIGVWVGNFDGQGVYRLTGAQAAAPLLFELFKAIDSNASRSQAFSYPERLQERDVCAVSGKIPEFFCDKTVVDYYIPQVSPTQKCTHMHYVFTSEDDMHSYCSDCLPYNGYKRTLYPNYSPALIAYYQKENIPFEHTPPHLNSCKAVLSDHPPTITSPLDRRTYITGGEAVQLSLECQTNQEVEYVYWYINDQLLKKVDSQEALFFTPPKGEVKISCSDDKGRNTDIYITVI